VALSLVMFDIDHFKVINDTWGHQAGDFVLTRVAQLVGETIRTEDLLSRYGGEEFALMLRETAEDQAFICAERCRRAIDDTEVNFNGTPIKVGISLGVASLLESDFVQPEDLLSAADRYLYRAKRGGRNRVEGRMVSGP
jgi:diguanylate cyclase (GGDEF)-like protein